MKYFLLWILIFLTTIGAKESPIFVDSLEDAIAVAESSKQDIILVFSAEWCKNCDLLKEEILYSDDEALHNSIICIVDYDKRPDLVKEYKVRKIPDSRILKGNIEKSHIIGYTKKKDYIKWLSDARK
jgi:thioredoxin-related protein